MPIYDVQVWKKSSINPSVYAHLAERYLFNFRLPPDALGSRLPAS
ncbi:MAG: hypothetical protein ABI347_09560 [Nitrososphaera sp.]